MEIVKKIFCNIRTPVLAGVFSILLFMPVFGFEIWQEREHPTVDFMSVKTGGHAMYNGFSGYDYLESSTNTFFLYHVSLFASEEVPILSRLQWESTVDLDLRPDEIGEGSKQSYNDIYVELRLPFKTETLGVETPWYLQYRRTSATFTSDIDRDIVYGSKNFTAGSEMSFGRIVEYYALAIGTPVSNNDADYCYSRAGLYYISEERARSARIDSNADSVLLKVREHQVGGFYDMSKPVFTDGFITRVRAQIGYSYRHVRPNINNLTSSSFADSDSILRFGFNLDFAYRFELTRNSGLRLFAGGEYQSMIILSTGDNNPSFNNGDEYRFTGGLAFDVIL